MTKFVQQVVLGGRKAYYNMRKYPTNLSTPWISSVNYNFNRGLRDNVSVVNHVVIKPFEPFVHDLND